MQETLAQLSDLNNAAISESSRAAQRLTDDDEWCAIEPEAGNPPPYESSSSNKDVDKEKEKEKDWSFLSSSQ